MGGFSPLHNHISVNVQGFYESCHIGCVGVACLVHASNPLLFQFGLWDSLDGYSCRSKSSLSLNNSGIVTVAKICLHRPHTSIKIFTAGLALHSFSHPSERSHAIYSHATLVAQSKDLKLSSCWLGVMIGSKGISGYKQGCDIVWAWGINNVDGQWDWE